LVTAFRERYRSVDVLMIDDIQFISNKPSTQEEFFHTFNDLYQNNKQIIISSDRPPKEIQLEDRLRSRFASGLIQDVQSPDFETRVAILRKKAQLERYSIDDEVINFIAEKVDTNIREMEALLSKVSFFATLLGKKSATLDEAKEAFKEDLDEKREDLTPDNIIEAVCKYFGVTKADLVGKKKSKEIVEPRMIGIYLINEMLDLPLVVIGQHFGGRDHTTIIHARDKITEAVKENGKVKSLVNAVKDLINTK
jgi:chromosomal replication initiator protein